jgi:hypothetical protein
MGVAIAIGRMMGAIRDGSGLWAVSYGMLTAKAHIICKS